MSQSGAEAAAILGAMSRATRFNRWMADTLAPWIMGDVLELGAGIGNLTRLLAPRARKYWATDVDEKYLEALREIVRRWPHVTVARCDVSQRIDFAKFRGQFETIVCLNVLEHVDDDAGALCNMIEVLPPGGRLVLLVPQGPEIFGSLDEAVEHRRRYSRPELKSKLAGAGFHIERVLAFNRITYPGWFLNGKVLRRRSFSDVQVRLVGQLVPVWRLLDRFLPWPPASLIAVCRKRRA